jgi:hypothetical protein
MQFLRLNKKHAINLKDHSSVFHFLAYFALYDTGADVCCISEKAFNQIPKHMQPQPLSTKRPMFKAANGEYLKTLGKFHLKFKIGEREVHHEFYKVRDLGGEDIILGINFIHRYHLNYDTEMRGFFWKGNFGWNTGILKANKGQTIKEYTQQFVQC